MTRNDIQRRLARARHVLTTKREPVHSQRCLILANLSTGTLNNLIGGNFFTGFLLLMQADDAFIALVTMVGYIGNMMQVFSPMILERFPSRKKFLIVGRALVYVFHVGLVTALPFVPVANAVRLTLVLAVLLMVNIINAMSMPGFIVWHIKSVPESSRAGYFTVNSIVGGVIVYSVILGAGRIADAFKAVGDEMGGLLLLRLAAIVLCIADLYLLTRVFEYPNESSGDRPRLASVFTKPLREPKYLISVAVGCMWSFTANIPGPFFTVYLLKDLGVGYSYLNLINMANIPILLFIAPLWRRRILRGSWFPTFAFLAGLYLLHYIGLAFVTKGTLFLYPIAAIYALALASGIGLVTANFQYMNMPATDQTNYISFYSTMANAAALLGTLAGRTFIQHSDGLHWTVLGIAMGNRQILMLGTAALMAVVVVVVNRISGKGKPDLRPACRRREV